MKTKHTPGPWKAKHWPQDNFADGFETVITDSRGHGICSFNEKGHSLKVVANACLIEQAPALLVELSALLYTPGNGISPESHPAAVAVLKAAKGKQ